ncbi:hypothetical protein SETIT_3G217800v2 [Setaria italica]|uniref:Exostosin GT47 domain-containing protein n=1 Tax=Setaria italica TaxID=4555 RepID=K3Z6H4_SETIT|nr:probable glucuronosyltransferase Os01g0926700 [Setaria italica]RCV17410.1 hypothetical protein SETIT_3G217800v2 [Setaria italica]
MKMRSVLAIAILATTTAAVLFLGSEAQEVKKDHRTYRISGSAGDVLEDDPVGRLKVYVYDLPAKYNTKLVEDDPRCLTHMFATEVFVHRSLLSSAVRTLDPEEADWFYAPVYTTCDLTASGHPMPFDSPRMMRAAIRLISRRWPYWNRTEGADHFFVTPHDFGACFHFKEAKAVARGILPVLRRATLVQTFGQSGHACMKEEGGGSITVPPYAPPGRMEARLLPPGTPRSVFAYFRGLFYDAGNDPGGGYYARGARAAVWENFRSSPLFDISAERPATYYEDMQRAVFCLCPLGWAPWSPRLVEAVVFGCIPVVIADGIVLPFADAIPWAEIGVFVAEEDVPRLDTILTSIPPEEVLRKQRFLASPAVKRAVQFPQPSQPGDAFHQILNGLARKLPHGEGVFLSPGQTVLNWTDGPPGDLKPW